MARRSVVVTGAASGIGKAIASAFAEAGDAVHAADISSRRIGEAVEQLSAAGQVHGHVVDVTDYAAVEALVAAAADDGEVLVMVNAAGVFDGYASIAETSPELWRTVIDVNLTGCFNGCRAASAVMTERGAGRIITIGSVAGRHGGADGLAYAASKAGIEGLTRRLAIDLGPHGITANVVAPGVITTDIRRNSAEVLGDLVDVERGVGTSSEKMDWLIPVGRPGRPDEVAAVVRFLASDEAAYITGQVVRIDGGWDAT